MKIDMALVRKTLATNYDWDACRGRESERLRRAIKAFDGGVIAWRNDCAVISHTKRIAHNTAIELLRWRAQKIYQAKHILLSEKGAKDIMPRAETDCSLSTLTKDWWQIVELKLKVQSAEKGKQKEYFREMQLLTERMELL